MVKNEYTRKPRKCPVCGSARIANILYGLPAFSEKLQIGIEEGRARLGGCCVTGNDPKWECSDCGAQMYRKRQ